jgi:hypothetical protein
MLREKLKKRELKMMDSNFRMSSQLSTDEKLQNTWGVVCACTLSTFEPTDHLSKIWCAYYYTGGHSQPHTFYLL